MLPTNRSVGMIQFMDTKEIIIKSALGILSEEGAKALTTSRLVDVSGISKGGIYHHFHGMEDIYFEILRHITEELTSSFSELEFTCVEHLHRVLIDFLFDDFEEQKKLYSAVLFYYGHIVSDEKYEILLKEWSNQSIINWIELYRTKFNLKISKKRIEQASRLIDMHICGLVMHSLLVDDFSIYRSSTKIFFDMIHKEFFSSESK